MTPEHLQANHRLDQITRAIREHELALEGLYHRRAGCVRWDADDHAVHGYCTGCGKIAVAMHGQPNAEPICSECLRRRE